MMRINCSYDSPPGGFMILKLFIYCNAMQSHYNMFIACWFSLSFCEYFIFGDVAIFFSFFSHSHIQNGMNSTCMLMHLYIGNAIILKIEQCTMKIRSSPVWFGLVRMVSAAPKRKRKRKCANEKAIHGIYQARNAAAILHSAQKHHIYSQLRVVSINIFFG